MTCCAPSSAQASRTKDGVFGEGSRATVAISILVKNPDAAEHGRLLYRDIGDYLTREQKLGFLTEYVSIDGVPWEILEPNAAGDWINQRDDTFATFTPIGDKDAPGRAVFTTYSRGLETGRDSWVYNSSERSLEGNVAHMINTYNDEVMRWEASDKTATIAHFVESNPTLISWTSTLTSRLQRGQRAAFVPQQFTESVYRPFNKQYVYFDADLIHRRGSMPKMFPTSAQENFGFYVTAAGSGHPFSLIAVSAIPDLAFWGSGSGQFFPRYTYEKRAGDAELDIFDGGAPYTRVDNVTGEIRAEYRELYGAEVEKDDIFYFVYGLLHSPDYRTAYAADLKKMLPRIPTLADPADFAAFSAAGRRLSELHLGYESVEPYPLTITSSTSVDPDYRVTKMRFAGKAGAWDKSTIRYNDHITLTGIPDEAHEYLLGSRSAIEWILERYQVKTDKASGIRNDPNDWATEHDDPEYILNLLKRIVTVSVETVAIVNALPALRIRETKRP